MFFQVSSINITWYYAYNTNSTLTTLFQVCKPDGSQRKTLVTGLSRPRAVVIDSHHGHMYWSEWGDMPRIARAVTDGEFDNLVLIMKRPNQEFLPNPNRTSDFFAEPKFRSLPKTH